MEGGQHPAAVQRLGQGRNNVKGYLRENPQVAQEIERKDRDIAWRDAKLQKVTFELARLKAL